MKIFIFLFILLELSGIFAIEGSEKSESVLRKQFDAVISPLATAATTANMNAYTDLVMIQVGPFMQRHNWIPMDLPDITDVIEHRVLLITYTGELHLEKGILTKLGSVVRSGDAIMSYNFNLLRISLAASMRNIQWTYDYHAEIMGLGPTGWLEGSTDQLTIACDFIVDLTDFMIYMQNFQVTSLGDIKITVKGNILVDWLYNSIINTVTTLFRGKITEFISDKLKELVQNTIDEMNKSNQLQSLRSLDFSEIEQTLRKVISLEKGFK